MSEAGTFEVVDGIGVITIDNPPVNALGIRARQAIDAGFAMEMHAYHCDNPAHRDRIGQESVEKFEGYTEAERKKGIRTSDAV